ncbi:zinc-binding alcohol dehydrogenase family protein [Rathayibacter sp. VKM Ac-2856]|uniref:zinc-binding alcohol dehydrogenase family protein n=1 Tax=unclassified Rathayibacter TaxID=2609250 RepID=UPI00156472C3|nr:MULTISPECIES: zinc-binding alcohol dehydrogenase family protein [unclassified Rathayibacter]NQX05828.1 zinc-binding alcohol dehydrogenase family protein [Rathayibacter sp. VKM Ac-2858]NQX21222.1 zinc-binding alcohol dehydrogenase family protein [Rathayibacter sp. VKM Ac-2856]
MRAVAITRHGAPEVLTDVELPDPVATGHDLLVRVRTVSVNPVDTKVRASGRPEARPKVLGFDAVGSVEAVGEHVTLFAPGDDVFYAGSLTRPGTNAELHLVDERIVGRKPARLDDAEAAALPLTAITAWELLFDRLGVERGGGRGRRLLVAGAAGGVGSMLVQLAARLTDLEVVATASTPESRQWVRDLGAHEVIDHRDLAAELRRVGPVDLIASLTGTTRNLPAFVEAIAPQGAIAVIDDPETLDIVPLKRKSVSVHWELMFTRPMFATPDLRAQHDLLQEVSALLDEGVLRTTLTRALSPLSAATLAEAHRLVEAGGTPGKVVVSGWERSGR